MDLLNWNYGEALVDDYVSKLRNIAHRISHDMFRVYETSDEQLKEKAAKIQSILDGSSEDVSTEIRKNLRGRLNVPSYVLTHLAIKRNNPKTGDTGTMAESTYRKERESMSTWFKVDANAELLPDPDVEVIFKGGFVYECHREVLATCSGFFREELEIPWTGKGHQEILVDFEMFAEIISIIFRCIYRGKITERDISLANVIDLAWAAEYFEIVKLRRRCLLFYAERDTFASMVEEWNWIRQSKDRERIEIEKFFVNARFLNRSNYFTVMYLIDNKNLQVVTEMDVCDLAVSWLWHHSKFQKLSEAVERDFMSILACIDWSTIPREYIEALTRNEMIVELPLVVENLNQIVDFYYNISINPAAPLQPFAMRPQEFGKYLVTVGTQGYDVSLVSLEQQNQPHLKMSDAPPSQTHESISGAVYHGSACYMDSMDGDSLFLTGLGKNYNEIWRFDHSTGWKMCAFMRKVRKYHSSVIIGSDLYSCRGENRLMIHDTVESYDIVADESRTCKGRLLVAIKDTACVAHNQSIYMFGSRDRSLWTVNCVQRYDVDTDTCQLLRSMPHGYFKMVPVVHRNLIILLIATTCFIYDITRDSWRVRTQYKTDIWNFGVVIENDAIFIFGGYFPGLETPTVRCASVKSILLDVHKEVPFQWRLYGNMPTGCDDMLAYGVMTLPKYACSSDFKYPDVLTSCA